MREVIEENPLGGPAVEDRAAQQLLDRIRAFLLDGPDRVELILAAVRDQDFARVEQGALELQDTAGDLGAFELQTTCERLQSAGTLHDLTAVRDLGAALRHDFEEAFGALGDLLQTYG